MKLTGHSGHSGQRPPRQRIVSQFGTVLRGQHNVAMDSEGLASELAIQTGNGSIAMFDRDTYRYVQIHTDTYVLGFVCHRARQKLNATRLDVWKRRQA